MQFKCEIRWKKEQVVCSHCMSTTAHFMHALNVKPYRKGNNWNRANLQLFNLPFGYVVSLAVSLFSQLIIYFHYLPTEFILSSFLWCNWYRMGLETKKDLPRFRNSSLCCCNRFCSSHASTSKRSSPSVK